MRIIFMGTPDIAAEILATCWNAGSARSDVDWMRPEDQMRSRASSSSTWALSGAISLRPSDCRRCSQPCSWKCVCCAGVMGVMRGDGTRLDPNGYLTRAQAAKLLTELT